MFIADAMFLWEILTWCTDYFLCRSDKRNRRGRVYFGSGFEGWSITAGKAGQQERAVACSPLAESRTERDEG